jgi:hypothetical protein
MDLTYTRGSMEYSIILTENQVDDSPFDLGMKKKIALGNKLSSHLREFQIMFTENYAPTDNSAAQARMLRFCGA